MIKKNLIKFQAEKELKVPYVKERCVTKERSLIKRQAEDDNSIIQKLCIRNGFVLTLEEYIIPLKVFE